MLFLVLLLLRWRRRRAVAVRNDVQLTALRGSYTRDWQVRRRCARACMSIACDIRPAAAAQAA